MANNHEEERKQTARSRIPLAELNQVSTDFAIAMALQEQERAATMLTTIESESSDVDDQTDEEETFENNYEYLEGHNEFEAELEFLEGQDSNSEADDAMDEDEEDDIDVDELTYEELMALGEFIGEEKRGLSLNEISKCLHPSKGSFDSKSGIDRCVICQVEYEEGELVVALPCEHPYHSECITGWLQVKKICPICSTEVSPPKNMSS
ncbi:hypothetical protein Patl1_08318 [Pistacia atlantica]|uniref:Uncharacterized protein n=1 Tax=Pistacia atlantica TaxID=434234 RepID=A0ACC1AGY3_9ROSI|nr:hypothetical protein Patl1_08318 [Pistacia atlantica]